MSAQALKNAPSILLERAELPYSPDVDISVPPPPVYHRA